MATGTTKTTTAPRRMATRASCAPAPAPPAKRVTRSRTGKLAKPTKGEPSAAGGSSSKAESEGMVTKREARVTTTTSEMMNRVLRRALTERMYLLHQREADDTGDSMLFLVAGQSGKVYTILVPTRAQGSARCNCPDQLIRKRTCKHLLFVLHRVLKVFDEIWSSIQCVPQPADMPPWHATIRDACADGRRASDAQVGLPVAVRRAFETSIPDVAGATSSTRAEDEAEEKEAMVAKREVREGDECGICYEEMETKKEKEEEEEEEEGSPEQDLAYCTTGCGNAVHAKCMSKYAMAFAAMSRSMDDPTLRCVLCRAPWPSQDVQGGSHLLDKLSRATELHSVGSRGVLNGRRLFDLSTVAADHFTPTGAQLRESRASANAYAYADEGRQGDEEDEEDEVLRGARDEEDGMRRKRQQEEREERARKRGRLCEEEKGDAKGDAKD